MLLVLQMFDHKLTKVLETCPFWPDGGASRKVIVNHQMLFETLSKKKLNLIVLPEKKSDDQLS